MLAQATRLRRPFRLSLPLFLKGLLLALFLSVQSFGVIHNAEHGFHAHKHHGHTCPIYDFCEHQNLGTGLPTLPHAFFPFIPFPPVTHQLVSLAYPQPVNAAPARAPPHFA